MDVLPRLIVYIAFNARILQFGTLDVIKDSQSVKNIAR